MDSPKWVLYGAFSFTGADDPHEARLAPYAMRASFSRGRKTPDHETPFRGIYQRDRDRIIHSSAFRRLQYKTQVFISVMEGDYYRNRLTHTLEVAQIARSISRALNINEDLTEALALAHDLGHGPFGHSGESALNDKMKALGGFDHNAHGLRIVDVLEHRYARFPGLNLTYETREGYAKNFRSRKPESKGNRAELGFAINESPTLEAQVVTRADEIAYDTHDLDDGLVSGAVTEAQARQLELWNRVEREVLTDAPECANDPRLLWKSVVRRMIAWLVGDLLSETARRIKEHKIESVEDVRACVPELAGFSPEIERMKRELERFLFKEFYRAPQVHDKTSLWQQRLKQLFDAYRADPKLVPEDLLRQSERDGQPLERAICDYVAGMTDRYASKQWDAFCK